MNKKPRTPDEWASLSDAEVHNLSSADWVTWSNAMEAKQ